VVIRTHAFCKNLTADMWTICFVLSHPAIHKFNQTLTWPVTSSSAVQAAAKITFSRQQLHRSPLHPHSPLTDSLNQTVAEGEGEGNA